MELRSFSLWAFMVARQVWPQEAEKCFHWCLQCVGRTVLGHEMSESLLGGYTSYIPIWLYRAHVRAVWTEGELWRCVLPQTWLVRLPPLEASFEWSHVFSMCLHSHPCVCSDLCIPLYFVRACPVSPLIGTSVEALSPSVAVC